MESKHITPERKVAIQYGENPTKEDIAAMCETISDYWTLVSNLERLHNSCATILLNNGDEIGLTPNTIQFFMDEAGERQQIASDEAYYGGD